MLGVAGTIFKTHTIEPLKQLGIQKGALNALKYKLPKKYKLHRHAVRQLHWIYRVKRRKEAPLLGDKHKTKSSTNRRPKLLATTPTGAQYRKRKQNAHTPKAQHKWKRRKKQHRRAGSARPMLDA